MIYCTSMWGADVEEVLAGVRHHVLVHRDTRRLQRLAGELLVLVAHQVRRRGELVAGHLLPDARPYRLIEI